MKHNYVYSVDESDFENGHKFQSDFENNAEYVAEDAARNYHYKHDGCGHDWPIDFFIFSEDGTPFGNYTVEREAVPEFSATRKA